MSTSTTPPDATRSLGDAEVLIAGGGPVGLALAVELGTRGSTCLVVEPRTTVDGQVPRAKTTSIRTMEHMRRWGLARRLREAALLPPDWPAEIVYCTSMTGRELARFSNPFGMRRVETAAESSLQIPQPIVEEVLRAAVAELPSVRMVTGHRVVDLVQTNDTVRATLEAVGSDQGEVMTATGRYLVGCDGGASTVRDRAGIATDGEVHPRAFFNVVFRSESLMSRAASVHGGAVHYWVVEPHGTGAVGPIDGREVFFAMMDGADEDSPAEVLIQRIHRLVGESVDVEILSSGTWRPRISMAEVFASGRVFLAGDAAHANPPWGGHGFNTGVGDAVNLGWKLTAVLQGWAHPSLLDSYDTERRVTALRTIADASANMRPLDGSLITDDLLRDDATGTNARSALAAEIFDVKTAEFDSQGLVLGYHYADSPIVIRDDAPLPPTDPIVYTPVTTPGARLPHVWLDDGDTALYDRLGERFSLVVVGDLPDPSHFRKAAAALGLGDLDVVRIPLGTSAVYDRAQLLLVRPDQHIAWRGERDPEKAEAILSRATGN